MNIIQRIVTDLASKHPNKDGIHYDFSQMSVEDAVRLMFMLIGNDARRDMNDILKDMEETRKKKGTLRESGKLIKGQQADLKNELVHNPVFANAVNDIKKDIAQQEKSEAAHSAAANADREAAKANSVAAEKLERDAGGLEQPVDTSGEHDPNSGSLWGTMMDYQKMLNRERRADQALAHGDMEAERKHKDEELEASQKSISRMASEAEQRTDQVMQSAGQENNNKNKMTLPVILSGVLVLVIFTAVFINSRKVPVVGSSIVETTTNVATTASGDSVPDLRTGLTMAWVDGSTLIFIQDLKGPGGSKGSWVTINPISNYQFSLCVQSGKCTPPTGPDSSKDFNDPFKQNQPISMAGTDNPEGYCAWVNGHVPTNPELAGFKDELRNAGFTDELRKAGFTDELRVGFHCIVDNPRPMAMYCQSTPYHDPSQPIADPNHALEPKGSFCQNGKSYISFDMTLDPGNTLQSVVPQGIGEDCKVVDGFRIVCGGLPGSSTNVTAGILDSSVAGILDSSIAGMDDWESIAGMDDWELTASGAPIPKSGVQFNDLGLRSGPFTPTFVFINGVMVAQQYISHPNTVGTPQLNGPTCPAGTMLNPSCPLALDDPQYISKCCDQSSSSDAPPILEGPACPFGYFFDDLTKTCVSVAPPTDSTCLSGYNLDQTNLCCAASAPNGNYPGCPNGQILDPVTGTCDPRTTLISATSTLNLQSFDMTFPACFVEPTAIPTAISCGSITHDKECNKTPGCSYDYGSKTCK